MKKLGLVLLMVFVLGCTTIRVDAPKAGTVSIGADKNLTGSVSPSGNRVPIGK